MDILETGSALFVVLLLATIFFVVVGFARDSALQDRLEDDEKLPTKAGQRIDAFFNLLLAAVWGGYAYFKATDETVAWFWVVVYAALSVLTLACAVKCFMQARKMA